MEKNRHEEGVSSQVDFLFQQRLADSESFQKVGAFIIVFFIKIICFFYRCFYRCSRCFVTDGLTSSSCGEKYKINQLIIN